ncbi:MAG: FxsA family protein [Pseudomonadota bacterium]
MPLLIFAFLILIPIAEIFLLIEGAGVIGTIPVILLTIGTAALGTFLIKRQGLAAMQTAQLDMNEGRPPVQSVVDGVGLLVAAPFLMTPGFITDGVGFLLLIPGIRHAAARAILKKIKSMQADGKVTIIRP